MVCKVAQSGWERGNLAYVDIAYGYRQSNNPYHIRMFSKEQYVLPSSHWTLFKQKSIKVIGILGWISSHLQVYRLSPILSYT